MTAAALRVTGLGVDVGERPLVRDVSFAVAPGERVGLIGESGSGKSLTALTVMGLLPEHLRARGVVELADRPGNLLDARERTLAGLRGSRLGMVFQEPLSALNPVMRVGDQVAEAVRLHASPSPSRSAARDRAVGLLARVRLPDPSRAARAYPHQLSGGQRQRVLIAMALANDPAVLICDEPTSALDVTVQAQILDLVVEGAAEHGSGLLFITHDLAVVASVCTRALVLAGGELVDGGPVEELLGDPRHPYTRALVEAASLDRRPPLWSRPAPEPARSAAAPPEPLLAVRDLHRTYLRPRTTLRGPRPQVRALRGLDLDLHAGQRLGVVGESGSGKSTFVRLLAGLDQPTRGSIRFAGTEIVGRPERRLRFLRENLQLVFQDPTGSLDPRMRVRDVVAEPLLAQRRHRGHAHGEIRTRVTEALRDVGLPDDAADRFPHEFSGGQRQRISLARALAPRPKVLVADEPVSALDAPIRTQILELVDRLVRDYALTLILVSHDLAVVRHLCERVAVFADGKLVEHGPTDRVYDAPEHTATRELLAAVPTLTAALDRSRARSEAKPRS